MLTFRNAAQDDLPILTEIYNQAIRSHRCTTDLIEQTAADRQGWFDAHQDGRHPLIVAELDGQIAGYATLTAYRAGRAAVDHVAEVSYYLDFSQRGKGVGSALLEHMLSIAPDLGITELFAICLGINQASVHLLEKHGFVRWGCFPQVVVIDGERIDHLFYGKHLTVMR